MRKESCLKLNAQKARHTKYVPFSKWVWHLTLLPLNCHGTHGVSRWASSFWEVLLMALWKWLLNHHAQTDRYVRYKVGWRKICESATKKHIGASYPTRSSWKADVYTINGKARIPEWTSERHMLQKTSSKHIKHLRFIGEHNWECLFDHVRKENLHFGLQ